MDLGKQFVKQALIAKRQSDKLYNTIIDDIKKINKWYHKKSIGLYDMLIDHFDMQSKVIIANSMDNLEKLSIWMPAFDLMLNQYRNDFRKKYESNRVNLYEVIKDKEYRIMKVVAKMGVTDDRVTATDESIGLMNAIFDNVYINIDTMLLKWRGYAYDAFFQGVTQSLTKERLRDKFVNSTGSLRIGSSLEETSELEASIGAVSAKTAYLQQKAKENGYKYCWNANPMDRRTKPICMQASLAGVISESDMIGQYGLPPRFVCRCEIVYTRGEWVELNQSINEELRHVRRRLIDELDDAPKQLTQYWIAGKLIIPTDPIRRAGDKMYSDIEEKLAVANANEVPDFEYEE